MPNSCEEFTSTVIAELRRAKSSGVAQNNIRLSREVYFSWDEDHGSAAITLSSECGELLAFDARIEQNPRWFALNIGLGRGTLNIGDTLVIVLEAAAEPPFESVPLIRSAIDGGVLDTYLDDCIKIDAGRRTSVHMHRLESCDALAGAEGFHTLTIGLPKSHAKVALYDLGVFVVPASAEQKSSPIRLSSFG